MDGEDDGRWARAARRATRKTVGSTPAEALLLQKILSQSKAEGYLIAEVTTIAFHSFQIRQATADTGTTVPVECLVDKFDMQFSAKIWGWIGDTRYFVDVDEIVAGYSRGKSIRGPTSHQLCRFSLSPRRPRPTCMQAKGGTTLMRAAAAASSFQPGCRSCKDRFGGAATRRKLPYLFCSACCDIA